MSARIDRRTTRAVTPLDATTWTVEQRQRFWAKVVLRNRTACWCWTGARVRSGYGHVRLGGRKGRTRIASHVAYELERGPWPTGMRATYVCRNRSCVNPWHVEPATQSEIVRSGRRRICKRGHLQTQENVYYNGRRHRRCTPCERLLARERRRRARITFGEEAA